MAITDHIANYGKNVGAGLLAGAQNQYAIQQNQQQNDRNAFVQDRRFNANQQRNQRQDQMQASAAQRAFGEETRRRLIEAPPEKRKGIFYQRAQEALAYPDIGHPPGYNVDEAWARSESTLPKYVDPVAQEQAQYDRGKTDEEATYQRRKAAEQTTYDRRMAEEEAKFQRRRIQDTAQKKNLTPAQKKVDEVFAKEYVDFVASGGLEDVEKQIKQLKEVEKSLKDTAKAPFYDLSKPNLTGGVMSIAPEWARSRLFPESAAAQNSVEEVVQRNLRLILGAQFTEREGVRLIARAYNVALDEAENAKRVGRLIKQIEGAARAKLKAARYYEKNGTLQGFTGKTEFTEADFLPADEPLDAKEQAELEEREQRSNVGN